MSTGYTPKLHPFASRYGWGPIVVELVNLDGHICQLRHHHTMEQALADVAEQNRRKGYTAAVKESA